MWVLVLMTAGVMAFGASAAGAEKFVFGKHAAQMAAYDAQMKVLKAKTAEAAKASAAAYARQDKLMAPVKIAFSPLTAVGYGILGLRSPTKSPFEYLLLGIPSLCRGVNTAKNHFIQTLGGGALDIVTAVDESNKTTYAPVLGEMGILGERTMKRGPIANVLETAAYATPISCVAAGVLAPIAGTSAIVTEAIFSTTLPVAAILVGEAAGMAEKAVLK